MSTLGRRSQSGEGSKSAYTSAYHHSFGEGQEPWQEHLRERSSWGKRAEGVVSEDATSGKKKEEKEELEKSRDIPEYEEVSSEGSPVATPDPATEVSESSESDGPYGYNRAPEDYFRGRDVATVILGEGGLGKRGEKKWRFASYNEWKVTGKLGFKIEKPNETSPSSVHTVADEIEEKLNQDAAQKACQGERDLKAPADTAGVPNPTATQGTQTETAEKKYYVYKAPHKVSYVKPWTWRFRRAKPADETEKTAGEGHYYTYKKRPQSASWWFWKWNWRGPTPIAWIPIYPSYHPEKDDPDLKIFLEYSCGHRFPTRVISAPTWTASSPSFLFSPSSPFTPNTPTYPRSGSTSGHPHIRPLPSLRVETLRAAARMENIKNIVAPENYVCPNCFLRRQFYGGLILLVLFWGIFTWYFAFVWPYTWWATTETGEPIPRYTMITKLDIHHGGEGEFSVRHAIGGLVLTIFWFFVGIFWQPVILCLIVFGLFKRFKKKV